MTTFSSISAIIYTNIYGKLAPHFLIPLLCIIIEPKIVNSSLERRDFDQFMHPAL